MWLATAVVIKLASVLAGYTQCYSEELGLDKDWKIELAFDSLPHGHIAATGALPSYYRAEITYDTTAIRGALDSFAPDTDVDAVLRRIVIHELWHVMMWEISELATETNRYALRIEEQLVTRISRLPFWQDLCRSEDTWVR